MAELAKEKDEILSNISIAANEGKTDLVLSESEKLEKVKLLVDRYSQIVLGLEELRSGNYTSKPLPRFDKNAQTSVTMLTSARDIGEKIRMNFVTKLEAGGIRLKLIKGKTIYQINSGKRLGIAVATERQPNRWFLGLPVGAFDHAALLCQLEKGDVIEILLPQKFFIEHGNAMSQSKGQIKFNVVKRGDRILVLVPGTAGINSLYLANDYTLLK
ncbi:MAG: hypothetical protein ACYDBT_09820 [Desulfobulbaceae bacterium]